MINVDQIFQQVLILSRKGQTGDYNGVEFNTQQRLVQDLLFEWYFDRWETNQAIPDSLRPFLKEPILLVSNGIFDIPSDYRHRLEVSVGNVVNGQDTVYWPAPYLAANEEIETSVSYVRKPSIALNRYYHTIQTTTFKVLPTTFNGVARLKYLANPADALWNSEVDTDENIEDYSASGSIDFEWEPLDEKNLVDLFLYLKGITTRQSELLEWVAQKDILAKK